MRVRFLSELEMEDGKGRTEESDFEDQISPLKPWTSWFYIPTPTHPARMLSNPLPPPGSLSFSQDKRHLSPLKPHSPGISALGLEEHWK